MTRTDVFPGTCDLFLLAAIYTATVGVERFIAPTCIQYPHPYAYKLAWLNLWAPYSYARLVGLGVWVISTLLQ